MTSPLERPPANVRSPSAQALSDGATSEAIQRSGAPIRPQALPRALNLGCGFDHRPGWLNVDGFAACKPELLMDLEQTPWPLPSDYFDRVLLKHVLEHLGAGFAVFRGVMQELYRVCAPQADIEIHVPHHKHDNFWSDPTHVRTFTPLTFRSMSKQVCNDWIARNVGNTMLAHLLEVDFEVISILQVYDPAWWQQVERGLMSKEALAHAAQIHWGVVRELQVRLRVVKSG
jgi:hypothetical protein